MKVFISSIERATEDIRVFELKPVDGQNALPLYEAGAHLELTLGNGLRRQYSLCCRVPDAASYRIAVKREPASRGGSEWLHAKAEVGMQLDIAPPRNAFVLRPVAPLHLLFAGGIGITPILSMAYELDRRGECFRVVYFARDRAAAAFHEELTTHPLADKVTIHLGASPQETGAIISAALDQGVDGTHVYSCGPAPFIDAVRARATPRFGEDNVHQEFFSANLDASAKRSFVIRLVDSGREIPVGPDQTALACLQDAGLEIESSCEVGICGTCVTEVVEGIPEHFDEFLSPAEKAANRWFMPCVSRCKSGVLVIKAP